MVQLFGRITSNAAIKQLESGKTVINFTIALNDDYKDKKGNKVQQVTYIRCAYWTTKTNIANYLTKGKNLEVLGRLFSTVYTNQQGEAKGSINATVNRLKFHGGGATPIVQANKTSKQTTAAPVAATEAENDLPF